MRDGGLLLLGLILSLSATALADPPLPTDYTPNRPKLPKDRSVQVAASWRDSVRFLFNRGENSTRFLTELLALLEPKNIRATHGFQSPKNTRITLMTYELRSREVVTRVEELLKEGYNVRIVADAGTHTTATMPSDEARKKWSPGQEQYFLRTYDLDHDGTVTQADLDKYNETKALSTAIWDQVKELAKQHKHSLELVATPYEMVPANENFLYPRLSHLKRTSIELKQSDGTWRAEVAMLSSANLTDSCMDCRISQSKGNKEKYLKGEPYAYAKGSQGHVQFGAIIKGAEAIAALSGPTEQWIALYKKGLHFDSSVLADKQNPRIVFSSENGARTTLQAFYSEGTLSDRRSAEDPVWALTDILSRPENELKVYYDAQFVFTHKQMARHLRQHLSRGTMEAFGVFVDGGFALQPYSAIPDLLFAHKIDNMLNVSPELAVEPFVQIPGNVDWPKNVFVYDGTTGVYGGPGDKLHSKVSYFEYLDGRKARHYVVAWGSANKSSNAGRLNADALFVLDSTDPEVGAQVRPFFDALREDPRMKPYSSAYLEERLYEMIKPDGQIFDPERKSPFLEQLEDVLVNPVHRRAELRKLVTTLKRAGAVNAYGTNFLELLGWFVTHAPEQVAFSWADFHLATLLANPNTLPQPGLITAARNIWTDHSGGNDAFNTIVDAMARSNSAKQVKMADEVLEIMQQCEGVLTRLHFPTAKAVK